MKTRFTNLALAAATSLGIALSPVPAAAGPDADDIAATIAGIAVLGLIAKSINDRDDRRARQRATVNQQRILRQPRGGVIEGNLRRHNNNFGQHRNFKRVALPIRCVRYLDTNRGTRLVYGRQCLDRRYEHANRLPQHCERLVRTDRGLRTVYGARCLSRDGWQVARR